MVAQHWLNLGCSRREHTFARAAIFVTLTIICIIPTAARGDPTSQPASTVDDRARLSLDDIGDDPNLVPAKNQPAPALSESASRQLRTARDRMAEKAWSTAATALERLIETEPALLEARLLAAQAAIQLGDNDVATRHLTEAVAIDPRSVTAHRLLGEVEQSAGRTRSAIARFRSALAASDSKSDDAQALLTQLSLGLLLKREGYFRAAGDALEAFHSACDRPTSAMTAHAELSEAFKLYRDRLALMIGECRIKSEDFAAAVPFLRAAVKATPGNKEAKSQLALALARSQQPDEALALARTTAIDEGCSPAALSALKDATASAGGNFGEQLAKLLESPLKPEALLNIAMAAQTHGAVKVSESALKKILDADPENSDAWVRIAVLRTNGPADSLMEALAHATKASEPPLDVIDACIYATVADGRGAELFAATKIRLAGGAYPGAAYIAGRVRLEMGSIDEAASDFEAMLTTDKTSLAAHVGLMAARMRQFRWSDAVSVGESAVDKDLSSARLQLLLGRSYAALDEHKKAEAAFLESFALGKKDSTPLRELAELVERRDDAKRCEEIYRRIVNEVDPRDAVARDALVRLYLIGDNAKAAKKYFADFAELGQTGPIVESTKALIQFVTVRDGDGRGRLERYRKALRDISAAHPEFVGSRFDLAMIHSRWAEYQDAMTWIDQALTVDAADIRSLELKAQLQTRLLDFDGSLETWKTLLKHRPRSAPWLEQLVEAHVTRADFDAASVVLRELLARDDLEARHERFARLLLAALAAGGHQDEALALARKRLEAEPKDISRRGRLLFELGRSGKHDEAIATARTYLKDDPSDPTLRTLLIARLDDAKRYTEAQIQLLDWLAATPNDPTLDDSLILMLWRQKNWDGALEVCQATIESQTRRDHFTQRMAQTLLQAGRFDQAIGLLETIASGKTGEEQQNTNVDVIAAMMQAERFAEAEKAALRIVGPHIDSRRAGSSHDPQLIIRFRGLLSSIYQAMGRMEEAYEQLVESRKIIPNDPEANNNLAYTWSEGGVNLKRAERYVRVALAEEPRNAAYLDTLGWVLYKRGRFEEAVKWLRLASKQHDEEDPVMMNHLADALARSGDTAAAEPLWKSAYELVSQDKQENRSHERKALRKQLELKIDALREGKDVPTSPRGGPSSKATSQPAATQPGGE